MNKIAVHAVNAALRHSPELADHHVASWCDHQFDAGEWSDAQNSLIEEHIVDGIFAAVAARFGMTAHDLFLQHNAWMHLTEHYYHARPTNGGQR